MNSQTYTNAVLTLIAGLLCLIAWQMHERRPRGMDAAGHMVFELVPLNDDYPTLRSDVDHIRIVGTMVEHRKYRRAR